MSRMLQDDSGFVDSIFAGLSLVGSACYMSVVLFFAIGSGFELFQGEGLFLSFYRLLMLMGLAAALLVLASVVPDKAISLVEREAASVFGLAAAIPLPVFGILLGGQIIGTNGDFVVLVSLLSVLLGVGAAFSLSAWGNVWSKIYYANGKNRAFCFIALTIVPAVMAFFGLCLAGSAAAFVLCLFMLAFSAGLLVFLERNIKPFARISAEESNERYPQYARRWLAPFNAGVASGLLASLSSSLLSHDAVSAVFACGGAIGSVAVCLLVLKSKQIPNLGDIDKVTIPAVGLLFALLPVSYYFGEECPTFVFALLVIDLSVYFVTNWSNIALIHCKWQVNPVQNCVLISSPIYLGASIGCALSLCLNFLTNDAVLQLCAASALMVSLVILEPVRSAYSDPDWELLYVFANNEERFGDELQEPVEAELLKKKLDDFAKRYQLTPREGEVLTLLSRGMNAKAVAELLFISPHTAKTHIYRIYQKVGVNTKQGLLDLIGDEG